MTNEETVYEAIPVAQDDNKEDVAKAVLIIAALIAIIILILFLAKKNKGGEVTALCLAEIIPLLEL